MLKTDRTATDRRPTDLLFGKIWNGGAKFHPSLFRHSRE